MTEPYDSQTVEALAGTEDHVIDPSGDYFFQRYTRDMRILVDNKAKSCDFDLPSKAERFCRWAAGRGLPVFYVGGDTYTVARSFKDLAYHIQRRKARGWQ